MDYQENALEANAVVKCVIRDDYKICFMHTQK